MAPARITTIISTSPVVSRPAIDHIRSTIESLELVPELARSPQLIVFDAPRDGLVDPAYEEYKSNVRAFVSDRPHVRLVFLAEWGHLSAIVEAALQHVTTPFLFVQQHDLPLIRSFQLDGALNALSCDPLVKYIRLNKRITRPIDWDNTPIFGEYVNSHVPLTATGCWSDTSHLTTADYYRQIVIPETRGRKCPMEWILNHRMKYSSDLVATHRKYGTFIYGAPEHPAIIRHSDARHR